MGIRNTRWAVVGVLVLCTAGANAEGDGRQRLEHAGLSLEVPGEWQVLKKSDQGGVVAQLKADPGTVLMILQPQAINDTAASTLDRIATQVAGTRRVLDVRPNPMIALITSTGIRYAFQSRLYEEGDGTLRFHWFGLESAGRVYPVALLGTGDALELAYGYVNEAIRHAVIRSSGPTQDSAATKLAVPAPTVSMEWPKPPQRKKKKSLSVPFRIAFAKRVTNTGGRDGLIFARGPNGDVLVTHDGKREVVIPPIARKITMLSKGESDDETFILGLRSFYEPTGYDPRAFTGLTIDQRGRLFIGISDYDDRVPHDFLFAYDRRTEKFTPVVGLRRVKELGDGTDWGSSSVFRPTVDGNVFVFLRQGKAPLRATFLRLQPDGTWTPEVLQGWGDKLGEYDIQDFSIGAPDPFGGYVFYLGGAFWRMAPGQPVHKLAKVTLPVPEGTRYTRPVILANGDIWMGLAPTFSITQSVTQKTPNRAELRSFIEKGGSSGFLRITPDGNGGAEFAVITGNDIQKALRLQGGRGQELKVNDLVFDPSTGGLLAYDTRSSILFTLVPQD